MHIRIACPAGSTGCQPQPPVAGNGADAEGCGKEIDDWFRLLSRPAKPEVPGAPPPRKPLMTLDQLPPECRVVLRAGAPKALAGAPSAAAAAPAAAAAGVPPAPLTTQGTNGSVGGAR
jgi:penicillin-insensitive murein endopeptidase